MLDGYEIIGSGELKLQNPSKVFGYGETVSLDAILTKDGKTIDIDSFNVVSFDIRKLTEISPGNTSPSTVVYDRNGTGVIADINNIAPYINFKPMEIRAQNGLVSYNFSTKYSDVDIVFDARIFTKDRYGKVIVDKKSLPITISVRSERLSVQAKTKKQESPFAFGSIIEAGNPNGILFNLRKINKA